MLKALQLLMDMGISYHQDKKSITIDKKHLEEKIVKLSNGKYQVQSRKGRNLGTYNTKKEAEKRLQQVHYFKHIDEDTSLENKFYRWQLGGETFDTIFSKEDMQYMKKHTSTINTPIYRCEMLKDNNNKNLKVGDVITYDRFRSFSKDKDGFYDVMFMWDDAIEDEQDDVVCFKTNGPVTIFDCDNEFNLKYDEITSDDFGNNLNTQKEIFVEGKFKVIKKEKIYDDYCETYHTLYIIEQIDTNLEEHYFNHVKEEVEIKGDEFSFTLEDICKKYPDLVSNSYQSCGPAFIMPNGKFLLSGKRFDMHGDLAFQCLMDIEGLSEQEIENEFDTADLTNFFTRFFKLIRVNDGSKADIEDRAYFVIPYNSITSSQMSALQDFVDYILKNKYSKKIYDIQAFVGTNYAHQKWDLQFNNLTSDEIISDVKFAMTRGFFGESLKEYLDKLDTYDNTDIYATDSPYQLKNLLLKGDKPYRIYYWKGVYYFCSALGDMTHDGMMQYLFKKGYADGAGYNEWNNENFIVFIPKNFDTNKLVYDTSLGSDDYHGCRVYDFGVMFVRDDVTYNNSLFDALGKPEREIFYNEDDGQVEINKDGKTKIIDANDLNYINDAITMKLESLKEDLQDNVLDALDKEFGQEELYMWSTYILPNGHFLNPDKNIEYFRQNGFNFGPAYEHCDFEDWANDNGYGGNLSLIYDNCIKMNVTYPYLSMPDKAKPTQEQLSAVRKILDRKDLFEPEGNFYWYDIFPEEKVDSKGENLLAVYTPFGDELFDLDVSSTNDIIKAINQAYIRGGFFNESLNESKQDIEKFRQWAGDELANRFFKLKDRLPDRAKDIYYWMGNEKQLLNLKDRYKNAQEHSNISNYEKWAHESAIDSLKTALDNVEQTPTRREVNKLGKEGSEKIYEDDNWLVLKINTYEASVKYGKGTEWCITGNNSDQGRIDFNHHTLDSGATIYFFINKKNKLHKYALEYINDNDWCLFDETDFPHVGYGNSFKRGVNSMGGEHWYKGDARDTFPTIKGLPNINKAYDDFEKYDE